VRASYRPKGIVAGVRRGKVLVHAGGRAVLVEEWDAHKPPAAVPGLGLSEEGGLTCVDCSASADSGFATQRLELRRPDRLVLSRTGARPMRFWCQGAPVFDKDTLTWGDGTCLHVTCGTLSMLDPEGHESRKVVGMGKLECVDPSPRRHPLVEVAPGADATISLEVATPR